MLFYKDTFCEILRRQAVLQKTRMQQNKSALDPRVIIFNVLLYVSKQVIPLRFYV